MDALKKLKVAGATAYTDADIDALAEQQADGIGNALDPDYSVPVRLLVTLLEQRPRRRYNPGEIGSAPFYRAKHPALESRHAQELEKLAARQRQEREDLDAHQAGRPLDG